MDESFGKAYKLCSQKLIEQLFKDEKKVKQYPFVLHYSFGELPTKKTFQVVISVPKRIFRKAQDRNRIKRLMREVFRKNKSILEMQLAGQEKQIALFLIYTNSEEMTYKQLNEKMVLLFRKLLNELE